MSTAAGAQVRLAVTARKDICTLWRAFWNVLFVYGMGKWRDIHWKSDLVHKVELRYAPILGCQIVMEMASLRDIHWESSHLVQSIELR